MFLINLHAIPTEKSEYFNQVLGAYVSSYIDYKDIDGAMTLAEKYVENEGWKVENIDDEYFVIESIDELEEEQKELFEEAQEYGYTLFFNCYESDDE